MVSDRAAKPHPRRRARGGKGRSHPLSSLALLLLALLAAPAAALDTVYLVRHAETERAGEVWPAAQDFDTLRPLTPAGQARADALAARLRGAALTAVYSSPTTRTLQTGLPLARSANIPLIADEATIKADRMAAFLSTLRAKHAQDRAILIVGHSNTIPELLVQLGAKPECFARLGITGEPGKLLIEGYEGLWRVDVKGEGCEAIVRE